MNKISATILLFLLSIATGIAANITGRIVDDKNSGLIGATVRLLDANDKLINGGISSNNGNFTLSSIKNGKYKFEVTYIGYETVVKDVEIKNNKNVNLGKLELKVTDILGETVVVEAASTTGELIKDTSQFNAKAFKTAENAVAEDLVKKIPGVEVGSDGSIKAQGESVKKVLVDGKPFFGNDPKLAMKNIPADMIDKVQIYDKNSDNSEFTGREDDEKEKAINFVTKVDRRKSIFGRISGGYGTDNRYNTSLSLNVMNDQQRYSLLGMSNNVSIQNFSFSDIMGMTGSSGRGFRFFGGGAGGMVNTSPTISSSSRRPNRTGGANTFMVSPSDGISSNHSVGLNYSDVYSNWGELSGSYFFNTSNNTNTQDITRNYYAIGDSAYNFNQNGDGDATNLNHKFNARFKAKIDSNNAFMLYPNLTYQSNEMNSTSSTISQYDFSGNKINESDNKYFTNYNGLNFSNWFTYVYTFKNPKRNFNISLSNDISTNDGYSLQDAKTTYYAANEIDTINQKVNTKYKKYEYEIEVEYIEPITDSSTLRAFYEYSKENTDNNNEALSFSTITNDYSILEDIYSSKINSRFQIHTVGLNYRWKSGIFDIGGTLRYRMSELNTDLILPKATTINYKMNNIMPSLRIRLNFSKTNNLRFNYYSFYNAPSATQLSEVLDVSNPLQMYLGNSQLKPLVAHNIHGNYMKMSEDFKRYFFIFGFLSFRDNYISNSYFTALQDTTIENVKLPAGSQLLKPINMDGYMDARLNFNYSFPIDLLMLKFNLGAGGNYNKTPSVINELKNNSNNYGYNLNFGINSNISENLDFNISSGYNYNFTQNSISTAQDYTYKAMNLNFDLNWTIFGGLFLTANSYNIFYLENAVNDQKNINVLNLSLGYKFLKNDAAQIELKAYDVLDKNSNIGNNITDRYTEIVTNNILRRYFLLTFTYNLKNFGF